MKSLTIAPVDLDGPRSLVSKNDARVHGPCSGPVIIQDAKITQKKSPSVHHAQICRAMSLQLRPLIVMTGVVLILIIDSHVGDATAVRQATIRR